MREFTGQESAADILKLVLNEFSPQLPEDSKADVKIAYLDGIPILKYQAQVINDWGEFVCYYRLDKMTATIFPVCEKIYDDADAQGFFGEEIGGREKTIRYLVYYAMNLMLRRLLLLQMAMFEENYEDTAFLTAGVFLNAFAQAHERPDSDRITKAANAGVKDMLAERVKVSAKNKRELLVVLLNNLPLFHIPAGVGRPQGSNKPKEQTAQEAAEFAGKIEETIRTLRAAKGKMPTKTAVAKALGVGGWSLRSKGDSSLTSFNNKLKRLGLDYKAITERVKLNK